MAVNLDDSVIRQFELAGITKEDIGKTIERDRAAGLSDQDITLKAMMRADQLEKQNPSFTQGRGVSRWISNLPFGDTINRGIQGAKAIYDATLDYATGNNKPTVRQYLEASEGVTPKDRSWSDLVSENYDENMKKLERTFQEQNYDVPKWYRYPMDAAGTIGSYGLLPESIYATVPRAAAFGAADAFQSGIKNDEKGRTKDRMINALVGGVTTGALTGIINRITGNKALETATKQYPLLTEGFKEKAPKTTQEALDIVLENYMKYKNVPGLGSRVTTELDGLFSNLPTKTLQSLYKAGTGSKSIMEESISKAVLNDPVIMKSFENSFKKGLSGKQAAEKVLKKTNSTTKNIKDFLNTIKETPKPVVNTEGLTGGIAGGLLGDVLLGPWGAVGGALLGSRGKILPMASDIVKVLSGGSKQSIAKAVLKPKVVNPVVKALSGVVKSSTVPTIINSGVGKTKDRNVKPSKANLVPNKNQQPLLLPNTTVVLPDNDSGESITQKHLQLLAALYPNFYQRVA